MPKWVTSLEKDHWLRDSVFKCIQDSSREAKRIRQIKEITDGIQQCEYVTSAVATALDLGTGHARMEVRLALNYSIRYLAKRQDLRLRTRGIA